MSGEPVDIIHGFLFKQGVQPQELLQQQR